MFEHAWRSTYQTYLFTQFLTTMQCINVNYQVNPGFSRPVKIILQIKTVQYKSTNNEKLLVLLLFLETLNLSSSHVVPNLESKYSMENLWSLPG